MSKRFHRHFDSSLLEKFGYLKTWITKVNNTHYHCNQCDRYQKKKSKPMLFEYFKAHLQSEKHRISTNAKDLPLLEEVIKYLDGDSTEEIKDQDEGRKGKSTGAKKVGRPQKSLINKAISQQIDSKFNPKPETIFRFDIANFFIQNNLSFSIAERLCNFISHLVANYSTLELQSFTANRKHISALAKEAIGPELQAKYLKILEESPYSISVDEGSLKGTVEYLAIGATFFENTSNIGSNTRIIGILPLQDSKKGEILYQNIKEFLFSGEGGEARKKNLIGISSDGASNMISSQGAGMTNQFKLELPYIVITHDLCHVFSLIMKHATSQFPKESEEIMRRISTKFSQSPQSTYRLKVRIPDLMDKKEEKVLAILRYVPTRWSSFCTCLERILELSGYLKAFFVEYGNEEERECLNDDNLLMMKLLACLLQKINKYIKAFQAENMGILAVVKELKGSVVALSKYIFDLGDEEQYESAFDSIKKVFSEAPDGEHYKRSLRTMDSFENYFLFRHPEFEGVLNKNNSQKFLGGAWSFLKATVDQITQRLPLYEEGLLIAGAFSLTDKSSLKKIHSLALRFSNIIDPKELTEFAHEIEHLEGDLASIKKLLEGNPNGNWLDAWRSFQKSYPLVYKLARSMQVLPYSTVNIERCFSVGTDIKTIKRNSLSVEVLQACLLAKQEFSDNSISLPSSVLVNYENRPSKDPKSEIKESPAPILEPNDLIKDNFQKIDTRYIEELDGVPNSQEKVSQKLYEIIGFAAVHKMSKLKDAALEYKEVLPENRFVSAEGKRGPPTEIINDKLLQVKYSRQDSGNDETILDNKK